MLSRRDFLKMIGMFSFVLTPLNRLIHTLPSISKKGKVLEGELYEGFLLLPLDAPVPDFVEVAPCPILGEVDIVNESDPAVAASRAEVLWFDSIESLKDNINFRIFIPGSLPHRMTFLQGYVIRFAGSGEVWEARLDFGFEDDREPLVSLLASPVFSRPYPVWPDIAFPKKGPDEIILDQEYFLIKPEKVAFTPRQGIMKTTDEGYMLHWIKKDVLYVMFMAYSGWHESAEQVGKSLVEK